MNDLIQSDIAEINKLHGEIFSAVKMTLDKAIRIGELLTKCKAGVEHGEWMQWIGDNLTFSDRTARQYMQVYDGREKIKMARLANLYDGEQAVIEHKSKKEKNDKTGVLQEGQSHNLGVLKDTWVKATAADKKRFLEWIQLRKELKIPKRRKHQ